MWCHTGLRVGPKPDDWRGVPLRRADTERQRKVPSEDWGGDWRDATTSQGMPWHRKLEEARQGSHLHPALLTPWPRTVPSSRQHILLERAEYGFRDRKETPRQQEEVTCRRAGCPRRSTGTGTGRGTDLSEPWPSSPRAHSHCAAASAWKRTTISPSWRRSASCPQGTFSFCSEASSYERETLPHWDIQGALFTQRKGTSDGKNQSQESTAECTPTVTRHTPQGSQPCGAAELGMGTDCMAFHTSD